MESKLTKEIYDKYPKVFNKIKEYLFNYRLNNNFSIWLCEDGEDYKEKCFNIVKNNLPDVEDFIIPFNLLYALLEDFFMDNGVYIITKTFDGDMWYCTLLSNDIDLIINTLKYKIKNEAKYQAIIKACEILEERNGR